MVKHLIFSAGLVHRRAVDNVASKLQRRRILKALRALEDRILAVLIHVHAQGAVGQHYSADAATSIALVCQVASIDGQVRWCEVQ